MKTKHILTSSILALALFAAAPGAFAQTAVPNSLSYQGRISDASGNLVGNPTPVNRTVIFRVWDSPSATAPVNLLYSEQQIVTIANGEFSVLVGQGLQVGTEPKPAFDSVFNGAQRFLGVTVDDGTAAADPEITPRQQLVTSAFAFRARTAEGVTANAITPSMLAAGAVTPNSIAPNAIDSTKLAAGAALSNIATNSIDSTKLAPGAVTAASIADNAVTTAKIADSSVTSSKIVDGTIASADLANSAVTPAKLDASIGLWTASGGNVSRVSGNVGIGITNPQVPLETAGGVGQKINLTGGSGQFYGLAIAPGTLQINSAADIALGVGPSATMTETMRLTGNNRVGIGTNTPTERLEVAGSARVTGSILVNQTLVAGQGGQFGGSVIATSFIPLSDARIKSIVGRSNPVSDLESVRKLQVTDYRMVDKKLHGDQIQKGFIAQEVQEIVPEAVKKIQRFPLPSIYAPATKATFDPDTKTLRIVLKKAHGLKKGDTVQLKDDKRSWELNVAETIDATTFVAGPVEAPISELFVYGKVVDDMLSVDYNRLFTSGIGAIQDLAKQVDAIKAENAELRTKLAASERRSADLEAADKARDARLAAIEKALSASGGTVVPAAANKKVSVR